MEQPREERHMNAARTTKPPKTARPTALTPVVSDLPVRRFTLGEYHQLLDIGVFQSGDPYELLNGVIVAKMGQNGPHASGTSRLLRRLARLLPDAWVLRAGGPLSIPASDSEPEPDFAVVAGPEDAYDTRHPVPRDVAFVVEVSDSSIGRDGGVKLGIYAAAKIPEYGILNVNDRRVEVYTHPRGGRNPTYRTRTDYGPDADVPVAVGGKTLGTIPVRELLP
jgi:Uma2 family endonuclease